MHHQLMRRGTILFAVSAMVSVFAACSKYQSFEDAGKAPQVLDHKRWVSNLPWESGSDVTVALSPANELFVYESTGGFQLGMIPLDSTGNPGEMKYLRLEYGTTCHTLDRGELLIVEEEDFLTHVFVVDPHTLTVKLSTVLKYTAPPETGNSTDHISFAGWRQVGDFLVFYHNEAKIERYYWVSESTTYSSPYIAWLKYDIYLINLNTLKVASYPNIESEKLSPIHDMLVQAKSDLVAHRALLELQMRYPDETRETPTQACLYLLDKFFIVDNQRTLIFSVENLNGRSLYFSLDCEHDNAVPVWGLAWEFAERYPYELTVTDGDMNRKAERLKSRDIVVKDSKMKEYAYKPEQIEFCPGGMVMLGLMKYGEDRYAEERSIIGIRSIGTLQIQGWKYTMNHSYGCGTLMIDPSGRIVYFPDTGTDNGYQIVGLTTDEGKKITAFPANIFLERHIGKEPTTLRIVGTAVDFHHNLLYIHDKKQNRIICADLQLQH